jgi:DNA-binding ferritin-like protein
MNDIDLLNMACISFCFRNDMHVLHHNVHGIDFEDVHEKFGELYAKLIDDFDYFIEHAILTDEIHNAPNMTAVLMNPNEMVAEFWHSIEGNSPYSVQQAYEKFIANGEDYLEALDLCREHCESKGYNDIVSDIDTLRGEWSVEINYKAKHTTRK